MSTIYLRKLYNSLVPVDYESAQTLEKFKPNAELKCEISSPRNIKFHRLFFAMLDYAYECWECTETEYKGIKVEKNRDRFRKDITILAGYRYPVVNLLGEVRYEAQSISFSSMTQDDFEKLYSSAVNVVLQRVLTTYSREDIDVVVNKIMRLS